MACGHIYQSAGFMSLSCESTRVTYETSKRDGFVSYIWRCRWGAESSSSDYVMRVMNASRARKAHLHPQQWERQLGNCIRGWREDAFEESYEE